MKPKSIQNLITTLIVIGIILIITIVGYRSLAFKPGPDTSENPYEYNIDKFKHVPENLKHYQELKPISASNIKAIATDIQNQLYIVQDESLILYSNAGKRLSIFDVPAQVQCITVDSQGKIYLGVHDHVQVLDNDGRSVMSIDAFDRNSIVTSVAVTPEFIYIADAGPQRVLQYNHRGQLVNTIGGKDDAKDIPGLLIPSPYFDVAIDPDGFLWVANPGRTQLENYTPEGNLRSFWGLSGMDLEGFSGCCNPSHFAILSDGSFVTSEKGLARIKIHDRTGKLVSVVAGPKMFNNNPGVMDIAVDSKGRIYIADPKRNQVRIFEKSQV